MKRVMISVAAVVLGTLAYVSVGLALTSVG
jgi:hypothetical protein